MATPDPEDRIAMLTAALEKLTEHVKNQPAPQVHIHFDAATFDNPSARAKRKPWKADRETDGWDGIGHPVPYVS